MIDTLEVDPEVPNRCLALPVGGLSHEEWVEQRRRIGGIGGSDVGAICGLDRWRSELEVWLHKTGRIPDQGDNEAMEWGRRLEAVVADVYSERTGRPTRVTDRLFVSAERPYRIANVDRLVDDAEHGTGVLEVKTTSSYGADEWADDRIPDRAALQTFHYLDVLGYDWADVACLVGGQKLIITRLRRDDDVIAFLRAEEERFWFNHVVADVAPPPDGSDSCSELLGGLWPTLTDVPVELPGEVLDLIAFRADAKVRLKRLEHQIAEAENKVKWLLADADAGNVGGQLVVTFKEVANRRFAEKLHKEAHPACHDQFMADKPYRKFYVPKKVEQRLMGAA